MAAVRRILEVYLAIILCVALATSLVYLASFVATTEKNRQQTDEIPSVSIIYADQAQWRPRVSRRDNAHTLPGLAQQQADVNVHDDEPDLEAVHDARVSDDDTASPRTVPVSSQQQGDSNNDVTKSVVRSNGVIPTVYVITPTHETLTQKAELTRLCYTLRHVQNVHWILVEDSARKTSVVVDLLHDCRAPTLTSTHLTALTPKGARHRGVAQRNAGIDWLRRYTAPPLDGLQRRAEGGVYFADDDNTYDVRLFEAVRRTSRVSVWLVGLVGGSLYEGPTCYLGKVTGWRTTWVGRRRFPLDMAGFAVGVNLLRRQPPVHFSPKATMGYLENTFLASFNLTVDHLTAGTDPDCSKVLVWHTQTKTPSVKAPQNFTVTGQLIQ